MSNADNHPVDPPSALPRGTRLAEFELRRVLGIGGFGIVYLAFDHALEREVAVKEYMPSSLVGRTGAMAVSLLSQANAEPFSLGLRSFVNEARLLARFDHPSLVKVHRYWEANNTAYMAMPYYTGSNLHAARRRMGQPPDEAWLRGILEPLLGAIERLHGEGVYHRDISPDNVILQADGRPVLLDFGAARRVLGDKSMVLTAILKPAYAPIEQYAEAGAVKQGPWTDLYSLGATLHYLLLGRAPTPSTTRTVVDEMPPLASQAALLPGCSVAFLQCIDWMLQPRPTERPQSIAALRERLAQAAAAPAPAQPDVDVDTWQATQLHGTTRGPDDHTVVDLSLAPDTPQPPPAPDTRATVLMPRAAPADATVVMPRSAPADATVVMPRAAPSDATVVMPRAAPSDATVVMPRAASSDATVVMPRVAPSDATVAMPRTMRVDGGGAGDPPKPPPAAAQPPGATPRRNDPMLGDGPVPATGADAARLGTAAPKTPAWRWPLAVGAVGAAGLALWLGLQRPAGPPPVAAQAPMAASAPVAAASAAGTAVTPTAAAAGAAASVGPGLAAGTASATTTTGGPVAAVGTGAAPRAARGNTGATPAGASTKPAAGRASAAPTPEPAPPPEVVATPAPSGPPSLATSITRLPPAAEAAAAHTPAPTPAAGTTPAAAAPTATRQAPPPATRAAEREAEPSPLQNRALSPAERCEGRALVALWACIDRICKADPALREHPDCVKARR